jgi:hypothetical protein
VAIARITKKSPTTERKEKIDRLKSKGWKRDIDGIGEWFTHPEESHGFTIEGAIKRQKVRAKRESEQELE